MASTNKTENFALNQWVGTDPVLMEDFNADNAKIDAALAALKAGELHESAAFSERFARYKAQYAFPEENQ